MSNTLTIVLDEPIAHAGARFTEFSVREPTIREYLDSTKREGGEQMIALISSTSGLNPLVVGKIPSSKYTRAVKFVMSFLTDGEPDGSTSGSI